MELLGLLRGTCFGLTHHHIEAALDRRPAPDDRPDDRCALPASGSNGCAEGAAAAESSQDCSSTAALLDCLGPLVSEMPAEVREGDQVAGSGSARGGGLSSGRPRFAMRPGKAASAAVAAWLRHHAQLQACDTAAAARLARLFAPAWQQGERRQVWAFVDAEIVFVSCSNYSMKTHNVD